MLADTIADLIRAEHIAYVAHYILTITNHLNLGNDLMVAQWQHQSDADIYHGNIIIEYVHIQWHTRHIYFPQTDILDYNCRQPLFMGCYDLFGQYRILHGSDMYPFH